MSAISDAISNLKVKLFADGADLAGMKEMYSNPLIQGFTTNPTLMSKAGVQDYKAFALQVIDSIPDRPISFEVFADEFEEMERQAIAAALHEVHGNRRKAADLLGIGERTLYRKISKYGLDA